MANNNNNNMDKIDETITNCLNEDKMTFLQWIHYFELVFKSKGEFGKDINLLFDKYNKNISMAVAEDACALTLCHFQRELNRSIAQQYKNVKLPNVIPLIEIQEPIKKPAKPDVPIFVITKADKLEQKKNYNAYVCDQLAEKQKHVDIPASAPIPKTLQHERFTEFDDDDIEIAKMFADMSEEDDIIDLNHLQDEPINNNVAPKKMKIMTKDQKKHFK